MSREAYEHMMALHPKRNSPRAVAELEALEVELTEARTKASGLLAIGGEEARHVHRALLMTETSMLQPRALAKKNELGREHLWIATSDVVRLQIAVRYAERALAERGPR